MLLEQTNPSDDGFPSDVLVDLRPQDGRGLRERLEHGLRGAIQRERLVGGTTLPPTRVLAAELGISRSVVVAAYANLKADGYLEAHQGAGTRVRSDAGQPRARVQAAEVSDRPSYFERPFSATGAGPPSIRLLGGLPDPALFPRRRWVAHYRAAVSELPDAELNYPPALGAPPLRRAIGAYLGRVRGVDTAPGRMLVCGGVTQGLTLLCRALHRDGARRIAVEDPCFGLHRTAIAMTGMQPVPVPVDAGGLVVDALAGIDADAVLVAPAHSYPTGGTLGVQRRRALIDWARRTDAIVAEDDYDAEFRYDRAAIGALQGLAPDRVVYLGCASKTVSPALRLGWVAAPQHLIGALEREKRMDDMGSSLLEQLAFARFVSSGDFSRFLRRVRPLYRRRRDAAIAVLGELLPGARRQGEAGGLHLYVTLPDGADVRALARAAYARGVLVEDATWHWADPAQAPPALVLGYGSVPEPTLRHAITVIAGALEQTTA